MPSAMPMPSTREASAQSKRSESCLLPENAACSLNEAMPLARNEARLQANLPAVCADSIFTIACKCLGQETSTRFLFQAFLCAC